MKIRNTAGPSPASALLKSRWHASHCAASVRYPANSLPRPQRGHRHATPVPKADWGVSLTHFYLAEDIVRRPLPLKNGLVALPDGPGLGIEVDEAAVERFRVR